MAAPELMVLLLLIEIRADDYLSAIFGYCKYGIVEKDEKALML